MNTTTKARKRLGPVEMHWGVQEIARAYGKTPQTVRNWIDAGKFGTYKKLPDGEIVVPDSGVQAFDNLHSSTK